MTRRQRRMAAVAMLMLGVAVAAVLTLTAMRKNLMNFYTPSDLAVAPLSADERMRIGGVVERGSLQRGQGLAVEFVLADCTKSVRVRYEGILPDLFREGQGIVATGRLSPDRVFLADEVLAKHDENYMPPQLAESLKAEGGHSCEPFKSVYPG